MQYRSLITSIVFVLTTLVGVCTSVGPARALNIIQDDSPIVPAYNCPLPSKSLNRRAIFAIVNRDADTNTGDKPTNVGNAEVGGLYFCRYVSIYRDFITWSELILPSGGAAPLVGDWGDKDVRPEKYIALEFLGGGQSHAWGCGLYQSAILTQVGACIDSEPVDNDDAFEFYLHSHEPDANGQRLRYFFNDLETYDYSVIPAQMVGGTEEEYNLYFIKTIQEPGDECPGLSANECSANQNCVSLSNGCFSKRDVTVSCASVPTSQCASFDHCAVSNDSCVSQSVANTVNLVDQYEATYACTDGKGEFLPPCACDGTCRNINDLLELGINIGKFMLGIIGSAALGFFVYGGFMMILSMGNAERVKKGRDILVAAIVGIVIAFSAFALINFVLDALNVSSDFRVIQ